MKKARELPENLVTTRFITTKEMELTSRNKNFHSFWSSGQACAIKVEHYDGKSAILFVVMLTSMVLICWQILR